MTSGGNLPWKYHNAPFYSTMCQRTKPASNQSLITNVYFSSCSELTLLHFGSLYRYLVNHRAVCSDFIYLAMPEEIGFGRVCTFAVVAVWTKACFSTIYDARFWKLANSNLISHKFPEVGELQFDIAQVS